MPDERRTFDPSVVETNRAREQGLGVGQRELETQRDPEGETDRIEEEIANLTGVDDGPPSGAQHGENHTRRPEITDQKMGQGRKTRAANRERVKGSPKFNPR
jgi:hypothetical protein